MGRYRGQSQDPALPSLGEGAAQPPWRLRGLLADTKEPHSCRDYDSFPKLKFIFGERNYLFFFCQGEGAWGRRMETNERHTRVHLGSRT